ncbi:MAG: ROK family protein [Thermodesulfobacteriota bacterium]
MKTYLAVDLGGTNVTLGLVTDQGRLLKKDRFPVQAERGIEPILADLIGRLQAIMNGLDSSERPAGLAVGAAGFIRPDKGLLVAAPNLPGWKEVPLARILGDVLGLEVRLGNDSDLYTLGEWLVGAGRGYRNLVGLTLGTGVGGGLVLNGSLWSGSFGTAAEIGHIVIEPDGRPCTCGSRGCLETLASATGMTRTARELMLQGRSCGFKGRESDLSAADLYHLACQGDEVALETFARAGWALGLALTGIFNLLGLEAAMIGGGAAKAFEFIYPKLWEEFSQRVFAVDPARVAIITAALGDDAPLLAAPALFRE